MKGVSRRDGLFCQALLHAAMHLLITSQNHKQSREMASLT